MRFSEASKGLDNIKVKSYIVADIKNKELKVTVRERKYHPAKITPAVF